MAKVITLSGLDQTASVGPRQCTPVKAHLPEFGREVTLCKESLPSGLDAPMVPVRRGRGRPKGSTVKKGAKRPWARKQCSHAVFKTNKRGQTRCQCTDSGMHSFQKRSVCERNDG